MVSLSLMARLVEAVRPEARLVLVGDPGQLASIEAGAVLGDIVGPAAARPAHDARGARPARRGRPAELDRRGAAGGAASATGSSCSTASTASAAGIAALAEAIRRGDADARARRRSRARPTGVTWIAVDVAEPDERGARPGARRARSRPRAAVIAAAAAGDAARRRSRALGALPRCCAPTGAARTASRRGRRRSRRWLAAAIDGFGAGGRWYVGRPLLVTENDYGLRLYNGDTGVVVVAAAPDRVRAAFERGGEVARGQPRAARGASTPSTR